MKNRLKAHLAVLGTNLFFAANFSLVKFISPRLIKPFGLNIYRVGISLVLFWLIWIFGKSEAGIKKKDIGRFVLAALTGIVTNQMLFLKGLTMMSTIHAALLMLTTPLLITLFAWWVLKESLTLTKAAGLCCGIAGAVILVASRENHAQAENYLWGDLLILFNAISYSVYFILVKPLMKSYSPLHVIRWVFTIGFIMILPIGLSEAVTTDFSAFDNNAIAAFIAVVITGTFLAYYFNGYGLQHLGAGITGAYIYTQPIFAVLIAKLFLDETLSIGKIIAGILIFTGVFLVGLKSAKKAG